MSRALAIIVAFVALSVGCATSPRSELVSLGARTIEIPVDEDTRREEEDGRVALRFPSEIVVTVQRVESTDRESGGRTARTVAAALARRVELGEREGSLAHHACRFDGRDAECTTGWTSVDGERFVRDGVLVELGDEVVWIDVAAPESSAVDIRRRTTVIRDRIRISEPSS